jgi:hypothetical protein
VIDVVRVILGAVLLGVVDVCDRCERKRRGFCYCIGENEYSTVVFGEDEEFSRSKLLGSKSDSSYAVLEKYGM